MTRLALLGAVAVGTAFWVSTRVGVLETTSGGWWGNPIWRLRALRAAAAAVVGGALGMAGAAIQGLLRNPLGEPYVLGVSSGAGVGVRVAMLVGTGAGWGAWRLPAFAFAGAALSAAAVAAAAWRSGRRDPWSLVLAGVMANVVNGAIIMALYLVAEPLRLDEFARWSMGELPEAVEPALLVICAALVAVGAAALLRAAAALNAAALGDDVAHSLGVDVAGLRRTVLCAGGAMTAAAVALAGPVGFVGLLVPHIGRRAVGPDQRRLLIWSAFAGAALLVAADAACRAAGRAWGIGRLPVGLLTALVGAPAFLLALSRPPEGDRMP